MTTMICTITPPADVMARLAACPALPRGERLGWACGLTGFCRDDAPCWEVRGWLWDRVCLSACWESDRPRALALWRTMARPLRVARERLREERMRRTVAEENVTALQDMMMCMQMGQHPERDTP